MIGVSIELPGWIGPMVERAGRLPSDESRLGLAVEMSRRNVEESTGGPFAAIIVSEVSGAVLGAGVNVVMPSSVAIAHGEVMAIAIAGQKLGSFDLGAREPAGLYTSCEPCMMCMGATIWSGVTRLVIGARDADAAAVGFDEGPKPSDWVVQFETRGIEVVRDLLRADAAAVLDEYLETNGDIYNAKRDKS